MHGHDTAPNDARPDRLLDYQRALAAFSRTAAEALPPERLMQHTSAQVSRITRIRYVKVMRYRPDNSDLLIEAGVGWKPGVVGHAALPADYASPPGRALQTGRPVGIENLAHDTEFRVSDLLREHGIVSLLNVPILVDGRAWGVLEVDAETPRAFDEHDVAFLATFANILGLALQRRELERAAAETEAECARNEARHEALMRELQHRVRNNFQVIISLLHMQRRGARAEDERQGYASVMDRVYAIALAHDQLRYSEGVGSVEFDEYLRALCTNIDPRLAGVRIEVEAGPATLPLDRAVPAGLIVNELVTNALKYAFDDEGGTIRVTFGTQADFGEGCVAVEDDGRGMGPPRPGGLGTDLVNIFIAQLNGRLEREAVEKGTRVRVCFPLVL